MFIEPRVARHLSVALDLNNYRVWTAGLDDEYFGGSFVLSTENFKLANGFSNEFWGWGSEDDDMRDRLINKKLMITRYSTDIARFDIFSTLTSR